MSTVTNVIIAGLGGQGIITASDILAEAAFRSGWEVRKSEIHGMSQRGGSVTSDVRWGRQVFSPMVPAGEAHYLVVMDAGQVENNRQRLRPGGVLITPAAVAEQHLPHRRCLNVALLGVLSRALPELTSTAWQAAFEAHLPVKVRALNWEVFQKARQPPPA